MKMKAVTKINNKIKSLNILRPHPSLEAGHCF